MFSEYLIILLISVVLSMDSFAVSIATAPCYLKYGETRDILRFAGILAISQGLFTLFGWFSGHYLEQFMGAYADLIAFVVLVIISIKMIYDSFKPYDKLRNFNAKDFLIIIGLGVATSIDAFFVGFSLSLFNINIFWSALTVTLVTFLFSIIGIKVGKRIIKYLPFKFEIVGGLILILIGFNIIYGMVPL
jgi:manganese efflux pump family protein